MESEEEGSVRTQYALHFSNVAQQRRNTEGKQTEKVSRSDRNNWNMNHWQTGRQQSDYPVS